MKYQLMPPGPYRPASVLCILLSVSLDISAQYYFYNNDYLSRNIIVETGCSAGAMNSLTDLGGRKGQGKGFIKDLNLAVTKPSYSAFITAMYNNLIGLRAEFTKGNISSSDALLKDKDPDLHGRYGRNLSFKTSIAELQLVAELHPLYFTTFDPDKRPALSPYIVSGIAYFSFDPKAELNGNWYALHPLQLEGQGFAEYPDRKPYHLKQFSLPIGAGLKCQVTTIISARLEIIYRKLFTDYLDDVSNAYIDPLLFEKYLSPGQSVIAKHLYSRMEELQPGYRVNENMPRGDKKDKDAFFSVQFKISIAIRSREN